MSEKPNGEVTDLSVTNDNIIRTRILLDADGDGFINEGVLKDTPPNELKDALYASNSSAIPYALWYNGSLPFYFARYAGQLPQQPEDTATNTKRGLVNRNILMSGFNGQGNKLLMLWRGLRRHQPSFWEAANMIAGAASNYLDPATWYQLGGIPATGGAPATLIPTTYPDGGNSTDLFEQIEAGGSAGYGSMSWTYDSTRKLVAAIGYKGSNTTYQANGYISGNYTASINTAAQFSGFPAVVAGQTYTLQVFVYLPPESVAASTSAVNLDVVVYGNNGAAGSPSYGRTFIAKQTRLFGLGLGAQYSGARERAIIQFTVPAGVTAIGVDLQFADTAIIGNAYVDGLSLFNSATPIPVRLNDKNIVYDEQDFSYVFAGDNQPYVYTFWVKSANGITKLKPKMYTVPLGGTAFTSTTLSDINVTSSWQRVDIAIPASTSRRGIALVFDAEKGGIPVTDVVTGNIDLDGFMITKGSQLWPYHAGDLYGYEDITGYVITYDTKSGKSDFNTALPNEGVATIVVNNDSKVFSPSNTESPYFGYLKPNLKVKIQLQDEDGEWQDIWSGWTTEIDVSAGRNLDRQGTIIAQQGMFRLSEGSLNFIIAPNQRMDVIARKIIASSGWRTTAVVLQSYLGYRTRVGTNAYIDADSLLFDVVEEGVNTLELAGKDWATSTDPRGALDQLIGAENGMLFINRNGSISIFNRNHWIASTVKDNIILDTSVNQAEYQYGMDIINAVEVSVQKNKVNTNQTVWETKRPVPLQINQVWVVDLNPEFTEGRTKTVLKYDLKNITKTVYTADTGLNNDTSASATQAQSDLVRVELLGSAGSRPQVRLTNSNPQVMYVNLSVKGDYVDTGDTEIIKSIDEGSINDLQGRHVLNYSSPVITNYKQAQAYGETILLRQATPKGEFSSFTIMVRNLADLARIQSLKVGDLVALSEIQSVETALSHGIIGEDFKLTNSRQLEVTYHLARTLEERFAKASISVAKDATANLLPNNTNALAFGGGGLFTIENGAKLGLQTIPVWYTGGSYKPSLALSPSQEQVRNINLSRWALGNPDTDASGNAVFQQPVIQLAVARKGRAYSSRWQIATTNSGILWYRPASRLVMTATGTATITLGGRRSKRTDDSVGVAAWWDLTIPVQPNERYEARAHVLYDNPNNLPAGTQATGQALAALAKNGSLLLNWAGSANTASTPASISGFNESNAQVTHQFKATDASGGVSQTAFQLYKKANVIEPEGLHSLDLIRFSGHSKTGGIKLDTSLTHYYTVFARMDYNSLSPTSLTLTIYAEDGSQISTTSVSVTSAAIAKLQLTVPSGNSSVWGVLSAPTTGLNLKVLLYGWGVTRTAVSSYTDLSVENDLELVYA